MQYPWLDEYWLKLTQDYQANKLPHALLITGHRGVGKQSLADDLAAFILCKNPGDMACGHCKSCKLVQANTHPDRIKISPEGTANTIKIDEIRKLNGFIGHMAQQGQNKIILLQDAHHLNIAASNALLKTLEEPSPDTYILLSSDKPEQLLATIRSRCQMCAIQPDPALTSKWLRAEIGNTTHNPQTLLALAHQSPLNAKMLAEKDGLIVRDLLLKHLNAQTEATSVAAMLEKYPIQETLNWLISIVSDLIKVKLRANDACCTHIDQLPTINTLANTKTIDFLYAFLDKCQDIKRAFYRKINLNVLLSMESLLITWQINAIS